MNYLKSVSVPADMYLVDYLEYVSVAVQKFLSNCCLPVRTVCFGA